MIKNLDKIIKRVLKEATGTGGGGRGSYVLPAQPGVRLFDKSQLAPFTDAVSEYNNARLGYDSYDGQMDVSKKEIKKIEAKSKKISKYKKENPFQNDDDGDILNRYSGDKKIKTDISKPFISEDLELKRSLRGVVNQKVLGLIFVVKIKMVNIHHVEDLKHLIRDILNVVRRVLRVKCLTLKNVQLVNKKERRKKHILNQVQVTNQRWYHIKQMKICQRELQ
jgi:hypothetical protein